MTMKILSKTFVFVNFTPAKNCGIAAVHTDCCPRKIIETRSEGDENQGWGDLIHTTEGKFSQNLIKKQKTKIPIIPEDIERNKRDEILMRKLTKEIFEIEAELHSFEKKRKLNKNQRKNQL